MNREINDIMGVKEFAAFLIEEGIAFHPDNDFMEYVNIETGEPTYFPEEANRRNELMDQCFEVCKKSGKDVHQVMMEEYLKQSGLDELFRKS